MIKYKMIDNHTPIKVGEHRVEFDSVERISITFYEEKKLDTQEIDSSSIFEFICLENPMEAFKAWVSKAIAQKNVVVNVTEDVVKRLS